MGMLQQGMIKVTVPCHPRNWRVNFDGWFAGACILRIEDTLWSCRFPLPPLPCCVLSCRHRRPMQVSSKMPRVVCVRTCLSLQYCSLARLSEQHGVMFLLASLLGLIACKQPSMILERSSLPRRIHSLDCKRRSPCSPLPELFVLSTACVVRVNCE